VRARESSLIALAALVGAVAGLVAAAGRATALVRRTRPAVMITVGGYASVAGALAAAVWRVPLIVAEQNAVPGLANRMVGRFAAACAVSFPDTPLPRAVVTGNPVRAQIVGIDRSPSGRLAARRALDLPERRFVVAVAGGSLGARRLNDAVLELVARWADRSDVAIRHVVGQRHVAGVLAATVSGVRGDAQHDQPGGDHGQPQDLHASGQNGQGHAGGGQGPDRHRRHRPGDG